MFKEPENVYQVIKQIIKDEIDKKKITDVYVVTDVNPDTYTVNIVNAVESTLQYSNVKVLGIALGNYKGFMRLPEVNDYVLALFIDQFTPVVIGTLFSEHDVIPAIGEDSTLICGNTQGCYIFFDSNDNIKINSNGATITINNGTINIQGTAINLNGSSVAIARVGDTVEVTGVMAGGATATGTITSGSPTVKTQ